MRNIICHVNTLKFSVLKRLYSWSKIITTNDIYLSTFCFCIVEAGNHVSFVSSRLLAYWFSPAVILVSLHVWFVSSNSCAYCFSPAVTLVRFKFQRVHKQQLIDLSFFTCSGIGQRTNKHLPRARFPLPRPYSSFVIKRQP